MKGSKAAHRVCELPMWLRLGREGSGAHITVMLSF